MRRLWRALFGRQSEAARILNRDPDLDLVKHMAEDHEYRIQLMERDLERVSGGTTQPQQPFKGPNRRTTERH